MNFNSILKLCSMETTTNVLCSRKKPKKKKCFAVANNAMHMYYEIIRAKAECALMYAFLERMFYN